MLLGKVGIDVANFLNNQEYRVVRFRNNPLYRFDDFYQITRLSNTSPMLGSCNKNLVYSIIGVHPAALNGVSMYRILLHKEYKSHSVLIMEGVDKYEPLSVHIDEKFEWEFAKYKDAENYAKIRFLTVISDDKDPDQSLESIWDSEEYDVNDYVEEQDQPEKEKPDNPSGTNVYSIEVKYPLMGFVFKTILSGTPKQVFRKAAEILYKEIDFGGFQVKISEMYEKNPKVVVFPEYDENGKMIT